jgi:hypothetical protein
LVMRRKLRRWRREALRQRSAAQNPSEEVHGA